MAGGVCTLVLQVKWGQGGLNESGGQSVVPAGLTEVLLHPVKQPRVGATRARWLVEVNDVGTESTQNKHFSVFN